MGQEAGRNPIFVLTDHKNDGLWGDAQHTIDIVKAVRKARPPFDSDQSTVSAG